jgi:hypothetical protein
VSAEEVRRRAEREWGDRARGLTARVVVLALLVAPANAWFITTLLGPRWIEDPTVVSLFWHVVFQLVLLRLANGILLRWAAKWAFSPAELLTFFVMSCVSSCCSGLDTMNTTFATMHGSTYLASPENHWEDLFLDRVPDGMVVKDMGALERLWLGESSIFEPRNYRAWAGPIARWWLFYTALWVGPAGLAVLFRRRWMDRERMGFPIVQLPHAVSLPRVPLLRHPAFFVGLGLAVLINLMNGLHHFIPSVPVIPVKLWQSDTINLGRFFTAHPWRAMGRLYACSYPFIGGIGLLLPTELSFSLWFFYLFWKAERIFVAWMGWTNVREFPFMKEQSFGGYLALLAFALWSARDYFADAFRRIVGTGKPEIDEGEPLPYRTAFVLFVAGFIYVVGAGISQKMALLVSVGFFVQYYVMTMIVGRIRAETGMPTHEIERLGPTVMQGNILGARVLGVQNLTSLSVFFGFTRGLRNIPYPFQLESLYLADRAGGSRRRMLLAAMMMVPIGMFWAFFFKLFLGYRQGVGTGWAAYWPWAAGEAWYQLGGWLAAPQGFQVNRVIAIGIGFVVYFGLMVVRTRFVWWPLHPMGFALSTTWYMCHMWFPMLEAWTVRTVTRRYLGLSGIRALPSLAFGLILGDVMSGGCWTLYSVISARSAYSFWP